MSTINAIEFVLSNTEIERRIKDNPKKIYGVNSSRIFAQIAKTGRNPHKKQERAILIGVLESVFETKNEKSIRRIPQYIPMKGEDIALCFGKDITTLPGISFVKIKDK